VGWSFVSITIQYLAGGILAFITTFLVFKKNPRSLTYQIFFLFGLSAAVWMFSVFIGRNAPSINLSVQAYRSVMFTFLLTQPLLLLTLLSIKSENIKQFLWLIPALVLALYSAIIAPYSIIWTNFGWSYSLNADIAKMSIPIWAGYPVGIGIISVVLAKKAVIESLRKKYLLIFFGFIIYFVALTITNFLMWLYPGVPPFGGVLLSIEFFFIAYAVSLPLGKIDVSTKTVELSSKLSDAYLQMLNKLRAVIPGRELGVSALKFDEYVEAMGLSSVVYVNELQELVFDSEKFTQENIGEVIDSVVRTLREMVKPEELCQQFSNVFVETYKILKLKSRNDTDKWFDRMMHTHAGFLSRYGILEAMPKEAKIPQILKELIPGSVYLFKEEKPAQAYKKMKEALNYGFASLCISKLHPDKVKERYDVGKGSVIWLTFKETEGTISPKDIAKLSKTISKFVKGDDGSVVLLDCFDQIKFANGFDKSLTMLKDFRNLCNENNSVMLISINPQMLEKQELAAIKKELREAR